MQNSTISPNLQRRRLFQTAALVTAAASVPTVAQALHSDSILHAELFGNHLADEDISIKLEDRQLSTLSGLMARVTIKNNTERSIALSDVSAQTVSTASGVYQINKMLVKNPLWLRPGGEYQFWVRADKSQQSLLLSSADAKLTNTKIGVTIIAQNGPSDKYNAKKIHAIV